MFLIFISLLTVPFVLGDSCCPNNVTFEKGNCWDPVKNVSTPSVLKCKSIFALGEIFTQTDDGSLYLPQYSLTLEPNIFCIANKTMKNSTRVQEVVYVCEDEEEIIVDDKVQGYCMIVSVIFLTLTAITYAILPELRDLQGKSIISMTICLSIGLLVLTIMKTMEYSDMNLCALRGFLAYYFVLSTFFWTNSISIQVLLSTRRPIIIDRGWKEYKWYALYSWGCPAILSVCMAIVNFHPGDHEKPGIGLNHCWFFSTKQQWYYMYSVMSVLIAANIAIFIYTSTVIWRHTFSSSHKAAVKFKLIMTVRLIVLMGLPWVFEMIGSVMETHIVWTILDIFNSLQGLFIFLLLVVFRKRVLKAMHRRGWLDCISTPVEKYLAVGDDVEETINHTDVPMHDK